LGGAVLATILAGVAAHDRFGPVVAFLLAAVALSLLAVVVGESTDQLGARLNPGVTGVLQSALGNLPELFVCIFSLKMGLIDVVKGALVGSILANSLLVLGLAIIVGGLKHGKQTFHSEPPKLTSVLLLVSAASLLIPTMASSLHTPAASHENELSLAVSVILLIVFGSTLSFFLKGNKSVTPESHDPGAPGWSLAFGIIVLALAGVGAAFVSEWFVDALTPATKILGISPGFTGLVVVAIAGNAIENLVGIQLMARNKPDYALSVILNSSLQIALVLVPVLVIISHFVGATPLTLELNPLLTVGLILAAIVPAFIVFDGESIWLEGVSLVGLYAIIAAAFWWG
jgi:Ca2+:H+ antiporter